MASQDNIVPENIDVCPNEEFTPGIAEHEIYAAYVEDFEVDGIAKLPNLADVTSLEAAGTIVDSHIFKTGKGFFKIKAVADVGKVDDEAVGGLGRKSYKNMFTYTVAGTGKRNIGYARKYLNKACIYIVTESDGTRKQIGTAKRPAYMNEQKATSGDAKDSSKEMSFVIESVSGSPAPVYDGSITEFTPIP